MTQLNNVIIKNIGADGFGDGFEVIDNETGAKYATIKDINEAFEYCGNTGRVIVFFGGYPFGDGIGPMILFKMSEYASKKMYPDKWLLKLFAGIAKEIYYKERNEQLLKIGISAYNEK